MSSKGDERSLTSGIPIPQWMRNKTENYGFDPSTLSPPQHEGDFFYIKFPKPQPVESPITKSLTTVIEEKEQAFVKHTDSCKQFIPKIQESISIEPVKPIKPMGVDDGFKGDGAACGASVVEVAHQMLSSNKKSFKPLMRGETEGNLGPPPSYSRKRRDSKSLPASPLASPESSPLSRRKNHQPLQNRLFGGSFFNSDDDIDKKSGSSWILSSLFAAKENAKEESNEKSLVTFNVDTKNVVQHKEKSADAKEPVQAAVQIKAFPSNPKNSSSNFSFLKSKPHLRDLNLLSPSSM